MLINFS